MGKDSQEDEDGQRGNLWDYLAKTAGNESGGHCCESHLNDGVVEHSDYYMINIRVYLRREFRSLRSDSHTICDSKHSIC